MLGDGLQPSPWVGLMAQVLAVEPPPRKNGAVFELTLLLGEVVSNSLEFLVPFNKFFLICHLNEAVWCVAHPCTESWVIRSSLS